MLIGEASTAGTNDFMAGEHKTVGWAWRAPSIQVVLAPVVAGLDEGNKGGIMQMPRHTKNTQGPIMAAPDETSASRKSKKRQQGKDCMAKAGSVEALRRSARKSSLGAAASAPIATAAKPIPPHQADVCHSAVANTRQTGSAGFAPRNGSVMVRIGGWARFDGYVCMATAAWRDGSFRHMANPAMRLSQPPPLVPCCARGGCR